MISRVLLMLISLFLFCGCANNSNGEDNGENRSEVTSGNITIAYLKSLCKGDHHRITNDYTLRGVIVANDWLGEFIKSIVVVDSSGGIEVAIESRNLSTILPVYSEVEIFCNGLMLARVGGKIELGEPSTGDFPIANIDEEMIGRYINIVGLHADYEPITKRFSEIGIADIGAFVSFENICICDEEYGLNWCDVVDDELVTTYRTFVDGEGNEFAIRTLPTCDYATKAIPTKTISVAGIIDYSNNRYYMRIANGLIR